MYMHAISHKQLTVYKLTVLDLLIKVKPKVIETEKTLKRFPCKTIGGPIGSQNKLKLI